MDIGSRSKRVLPAIGISAGIIAFTAGTAATAGAAAIPFNDGTQNACEQVWDAVGGLPRIAREQRNREATSILRVGNTSKRCEARPT